MFRAKEVEQRRERCKPVPHGRPAKAAQHKLVAPRRDVGGRHLTKLLRPVDAGEAHKIPHSVLVDAARVGVGEIGEPLKLGRHIGEPMELGHIEDAEPGATGKDFDGKLVGGHRDRSF
jgi:hypothetical protein